MRDTLLLVLAALKQFWHTVKLGLVQDEPIAMQCAEDREERERRERSERVWCAIRASKAPSVRPWTAWTRTTEMHPHRHAVVTYDSLADFHTDVRIEVEMRASRRAGARGESDG